ncbi:bifunctional helix-turn-helix transcriptional regulator/GNAT family N-acetyltransferase [Brevibacillus choshinensis]|uniref:MarR family transcriptional regulator n=1 Tax=Brevibacillus choshinensis TaxID=54911 RepID=A0ABX7FVG7_BRECH|nr:helix-turn-helix domain-containing GNAT family N-acetyltransferase [Brevibacillus choshinensis]QRG70246.1 MarR family transcriptional regulator [Brevibacillus choshinensis]
MELMQAVEKIRKFNRYYANLLGKIDQEIYHKPFPLTEARVITEIYVRNGCTATEVRETLGIDKGYMSRILQRFEEDHVIRKERRADDQRQYVLYLTEEGKEIYHRLADDANREVGKMIQPISKSDQAKLVTSMETIESILASEAPPEVMIRPFRPGDVGYVGHLHGKLYRTTYQFGQMFEYYVMKGLTEFMLDNAGGNLWIAEVNGQLVGSIAITRSTEQVAQLRWFVIDEQFQGLGIGKKLMDTAISFCVEQGYRHVFLWTVNILETARYLYRKYNFSITEEKLNAEWTKSTIMEERWDLELTNQEA